MRPIDADALLENYGLKDAVKYGNKDALQQSKSYSTLMLYEIANLIEDAPTIIPAATNWTPCEDGLPKDATEDDLFRIFVQITTKSGTVRREFTKEASFRCGKWIDQNGFIVGSSRYEPCKETVIAYHRVLPLYRTDKNG